MFERLKRRVERSDNQHLSSQMDEIRNDVNMLMRTLGMKIHATPLLKFRESIRQMKKDGTFCAGEGKNGRVTQADVDSLLTKFGQNGIIDPEGLLAMLEEFTRYPL
eukprot:3243225-Pyramimonas_sp.AAC.1